MTREADRGRAVGRQLQDEKHENLVRQTIPARRDSSGGADEDQPRRATPRRTQQHFVRDAIVRDWTQALGAPAVATACGVTSKCQPGTRPTSRAVPKPSTNLQPAAKPGNLVLPYALAAIQSQRRRCQPRRDRYDP